jgi:acyl-CoA dehydrogenase
MGGGGLGITEAAIMMQVIAESGAGMAGASAVRMSIFGLNPVVVFGTPEQQRRMLPPLIAGKEKACFAVTEPNAGLETARIATRAVRCRDRYVINVVKVWISTGQVADRTLIRARTSPLDAVNEPTAGLSLFYTALDRRFIEVREIEKMGRKAVDSNELFIEGLEVPVEDRIGEDGAGLRVHSPRAQPRADFDRRRSRRTRPCSAKARHGLCQTAYRVRASDWQKPSDPASAG